MVFISWNVNGLRACMKKGFSDFYQGQKPDFLCLQETKMERGQADVPLGEGVLEFWNSAEKKGYSGTAVFTPHAPLAQACGMDLDRHDHEGRLITLEYEAFYLVCCYTPNAKRGLERIGYRMIWEDDFRQYLCGLDKVKPVVLCGDLNVAHQEIDLKHPGPNRGNAGFSDEERGKMTELLSAGFIDSFRTLYPDKTGAYSWWSYQANARASNTGWRIDYFVLSRRLRESLAGADIFPEIMGSDHCPVGVTLDLT